MNPFRQNNEWRSPFESRTAVLSAPSPLIQGGVQTLNQVQHRILVADDDPLVRGSLAEVLQSEGYVVNQAQNGFEAISRAIRQLPNLVLLDISMPHWDGWTAFTQLDRVLPLLPVIVITARPNQYEKAVRLRVDALMEKPLNIPLLLRSIHRLTREEKERRVRRRINPLFVTELLVNGEHDANGPASSSSET